MLIAGASSDASSPAVMPMLRTMGFSPYQPVAAAPPQPPLSGVGQVTSTHASVVSLGDLSAAVPLQQALAHSPEYQTHSGAGVAELARLTSARMLRMAQMGVPPPCVTHLAEAGISADNISDLPWAVLANIVQEISVMGVAQLTLLRVLQRFNK